MFDDQDGFRIVRLLVNRDKTALLDPGFRFNAGESVKIVVAGIPNADLPSLRLYIHSKEPPFGPLVTPPSHWATTPDAPDEAYATLDFATTAVAEELAETTPGEIKTARLYVADAFSVWVDCDVSLTPAPFGDTQVWPDAVPPFLTPETGVTKEDLASGLASIASMPTLSPAQREARLQALLDVLIAAAT